MFCFPTQGTPADVLYKGTITRLITEDSSRAERERDEALPKGHVVYEGVSAQILTYDREYNPIIKHAFVFFFCCKVCQRYYNVKIPYIPKTS